MFLFLLVIMFSAFYQEAERKEKEKKVVRIIFRIVGKITLDGALKQ